MRTAIDWSTKPPPWCWIGPQFREQCQRIAAGDAPSPPVQCDPRPTEPQRKHRPARPSNPERQRAKAQRDVEISVTKERLKIEHEIRAAGVKRNPPGRRYPAQRYFDDDDAEEAAQAIIKAAGEHAA